MRIVVLINGCLSEAVADSWCAVLAECDNVAQGLQITIVCAFKSADYFFIRNMNILDLNSIICLIVINAI